MEYPTCTLSSIIDPGKYSVVSTDKEHVSEVLALEENMKKEMMSDDTSEFEISSQMCVAVTNMEGEYRRGVIKKKLGSDFYQVMLIDYGFAVHADKSNIKVITNKNFMEVEPLAFTVKLYGLLPVKYYSRELDRKPRALKDWSLESKAFIKNLLQCNSKIVVQSILIKQRIVYGDLFLQLQPKTKLVSLRKLLCKNEFCVYSESNFLRQEGLDQTTESVELEAKMELVEKWQKENFGSQISSVQIRTPAPNSNSTSTDFSLSNSTSKSVFKLPKPPPSYKSGDTHETGSVYSSTVGLGRGKIKVLIAEMKKKQRALDADNNGSQQIDSTSKHETHVTLGRGRLLKNYLEIQKSLKSNADPSPEVETSSTGESRKVISDGFSDVKKFSEERSKREVNSHKGFFKMEKAILKPWESRELSECNEMTEVSLSTEEERPPLLRNAGKNFGRKKLRLDKTRNRDELNEGRSGLASKSSENFDSEEKDLHLMLEKFSSECSQKYWSDEDNVQESQSMSKSSWTPYVLFDDCLIEPVKSFRELRVQPDIIKNLERAGAFCCLSQVQSWMIPSIRRQLNTVVIGSTKTGKTLGYLVPLMDYIQDGSYFEELPQGNGPSLVIVASSSRTCESIYDFSRSLIGRSKVKIVLAHGGHKEKELWIKLTNGCDVLISTPQCLVRLLETPIITNFERLTCLVLDEVDIISHHPFRKSLRVILEKAQFSTKNRHYQKILCGEKWTTDVEYFVKTYVESYALVIGSYSEAVAYEGLRPRIYIVDKREKMEVLLNKVNDLKKLKVLVACELTSEAICLNDFLIARGILSLVAHENILADKLKDITKLWKSLRESVLIVTDGVLNELKIREAQALIHYSLPCKSKTNFYLRYFTLDGFLREKHMFAKAKTKSVNNELHDIILIDDENHYQLPHIVDFVKRLKGKLPVAVTDKCEEIRRIIEVQKRNSPICGNLLSLGRCRNVDRCPRRHVFVKAWDSPVSLPTAGWVNFVVLRTHDASCFSVSLVESIDANGKTTKWSEHHLELSGKMSEFSKARHNQRAHGMPKIGDVCAVLDEEAFFRAEVIEYRTTDKYGKPSEVIVRLMDRGDVLIRKGVDLYELPKELSKYPAIAVDVRTVGLQPLDCDVSWSQIANEFAKELMTGHLEENQYWSGKIVLALKGTLFLDPIKRKQFLPHLNTHVFDLMVSTEFLNNGIAVANSHHLPALEKLCSDGNIKISEVEETRKEEPDAVHPQWAFFDEDFVRVRFLAAESTSTVFLQPKKFEKLLLKLEEDCQKEAVETKAEERQKVGVGMFCLALFDDGKWNRGRIESEQENEFDVYFVDHGDFVSVAKANVMPISESLLLRLPCQAIECELVGVEKTKECPLNVLETIYAFSEDGEEDLYACIAAKNLTASVTNGRKYSLNLLNKEGVSLNKMLVDRGMVRGEESEREHLVDIQVNVTDDEGDEEEEETVDCEMLPAGESERNYLTDMQVYATDDKRDEDGNGKNRGFKFPENYFASLDSDDVFEEEDAKEFLRQFASLQFSKSCQPRQQTAREVKSDVNSTLKVDAKASAKAVQNGGKPEEKPERKRDLELKGRGNVLTPQVQWCQNQLEVQIKILLGNVKDYSFECTVRNISFRCSLGDKFYAMDLKLYGAINPELTKVIPKAFHVSVVLTKLSYPLWPRLHADEGRLRWINLDVESLAVKGGVFSERIRSAKLEIESGMLKKGIRAETILPCSDSEDFDGRQIDTDSEEGED